MTGHWVITCERYTTRPLRTEEEARRKMAQVEEFAACLLPHRVVGASETR